jgi:hypothetical protein
VREREQLVEFPYTERIHTKMARLFRTKARSVPRVARLLTLGAAASAMIAVVSSGGAAQASTAENYAASVKATGLDLSLFGNTLSGGFASACVNSGSATANPGTKCDGSATQAHAAGQGILLTTSGLTGSAPADASGANSSSASPTGSKAPVVDWSTTDTPTITTPASGLTCSPLSSGGPQGSSGVTLDLGVACANAQAVIDGNGVPSADGYGEVAHLNVDLNGILGQVLGASASSSGNNCDQNTPASSPLSPILNGVCEVLNSVGSKASSSPVGTSLFSAIDQALQSLQDVATKDLADTVSVEVGPAVAQISQASDGAVTVGGFGSTLTVGLLDGVGCIPGTSLVTCASDAATSLATGAPDPVAAPLVSVNVGPSSCIETRDPSTGNWTATTKSAVVTVEVNLPGDAIPIDILQNTGVNQTILAGTPLQSTIRLASATGAPVGDTSSCAADSVTLSLLENSTFPGGSSNAGTGGAIFASLGNTTASVASGAATPPSVSPTGGSVTPAAPTSVVTSPTSIHTGEWWAGSLPLLGVLAAIGGVLIGWPRLRKLPMLARLVSRSSR